MTIRYAFWFSTSFNYLVLRFLRKKIISLISMCNLKTHFEIFQVHIFIFSWTLRFKCPVCAKTNVWLLWNTCIRHHFLTIINIHFNHIVLNLEVINSRQFSHLQSELSCDNIYYNAEWHNPPWSVDFKESGFSLCKWKVHTVLSW